MKNGNTKQVKWWEPKSNNEQFCTICDLLPDGWQCFERSSWDTTWIPVPATEDRIIKAEMELNREQMIND